VDDDRGGRQDLAPQCDRAYGVGIPPGVHRYVGWQADELAGGEPVDRSGPTGTVEGDSIDGDWEYRPVQLPGDVSRMTAAVRLAIQAEFGGWELSRVRLYPGGVRKVWLRRRRSSRMLPELSV
jgi:hypothetical protein